MATMTPNSNDDWTSFSFRLFIMFLMRDGWSWEDAWREKNVLKSINANPKFSGKKLSKAYFHINRTNCTKRLNRAGRQAVMLTFESACNHASIYDYPADGQ